jgi:hypothetical protein
MWTFRVLFVQLTGKKGKAVLHAMKAYGGVEVQLHAFLTSVIHGREWSSARPGRFTPGKNPGTHWIRGWVGSSVGLDVLEHREMHECQQPAHA